MVPPAAACFTIQHTILVIAISCKSQCASRPSILPQPLQDIVSVRCLIVNKTQVTRTTHQPPHNRTHERNTRPNHLAAIGGCATTVRATSHAWVGGRAEVSMGINAVLWKSIIFLVSPPLAKPTPLQYYCTPIAQYTPPPSAPLLYAKHHTILVMAISCKGEILPPGL